MQDDLIGKSLGDAKVVASIFEKLEGRRLRLAALDEKTQAEFVREAILAHRVLDRDRNSADLLNKRDLERVTKMNCGCLGVSQGSLGNSPAFRLYSRPDSGWKNVSKLEVRINTTVTPLGISAQEMVDAAVAAMSIWNQVSGVPKLVQSSASPHIAVSFVGRMGSFSEDPHGAINSSLVAHGDFPPPNWQHVGTEPLPVCLSLDETWSLTGQVGQYDLQTVLIHEFGHCLGLQHRDSTSVMYYQVPAAMNRVIDTSTANAATKLYQ